MSDKKLLPCPFCGGEVLGIADKSVPGRYLEFGRIVYHKVYVECKKCYSRGGQALGKTVGEVFDEVPSYITTIEELKKRAISNWNTRKPMERIVERLEEEYKDAQTEYSEAEYQLMEMSEKDSGYISQNYRKDMNEGMCFAFDDAIDIVKEEGLS